MPSPTKLSSTHRTNTASALLVAVKSTSEAATPPSGPAWRSGKNRKKEEEKSGFIILVLVAWICSDRTYTHRYRHYLPLESDGSITQGATSQRRY